MSVGAPRTAHSSFLLAGCEFDCPVGRPPGGGRPVRNPMRGAPGDWTRWRCWQRIGANSLCAELPGGEDRAPVYACMGDSNRGRQENGAARRLLELPAGRRRGAGARGRHRPPLSGVRVLGIVGGRPGGRRGAADLRLPFVDELRRLVGCRPPARDRGRQLDRQVGLEHGHADAAADRRRGLVETTARRPRPS